MSILYYESVKEIMVQNTILARGILEKIPHPRALPAAQGPRGRRPEARGRLQAGPEGVGIIFHEPKGMGWHFVIINRQAGLLLHLRMPWSAYALTM